MEEKTILITGATSGIGLEGARQLAARAWRVFVHARNEARGRVALAALGTGRFELVYGDLSDLSQIGPLADQVKAATGRLDVLWNNAGMMATTGQTNPQGFELQWAINHLAPFVLTHRLLPLLTGGRVVATSSLMHHLGRVPTGFTLGPGKYNGWTTYGSTKLANILFVQELARRNPGLEAHAFHPGYVRTEFGSTGPGTGNANSWLSWAQIPVEKGAATGVFLATEPRLEGSGRYWSSLKVRRGSRQVHEANAARLWQLTESAVSSFL